MINLFLAFALIFSTLLNAHWSEPWNDFEPDPEIVKFQQKQIREYLLQDDQSRLNDFNLLKIICDTKETEIRDSNNLTPILAVCANGNLEVILGLIQLGANINVVDKDNKTPLDLARHKRRSLTSLKYKSMYFEDHEDFNMRFNRCQLAYGI